MKKDDPLFGLIEFRRELGFIGAGYWQGKIEFPPTGKTIEIFIRAGRSGINEAQRNFYKELEQRYESMMPSILSVLDDLPGNYIDGDNLIDEFGEPQWKDFDLDGILIPNLPHPEPEWNLSYCYLPGSQIYYVYLSTGQKLIDI